MKRLDVTRTVLMSIAVKQDSFVREQPSDFVGQSLVQIGKLVENCPGLDGIELLRTFAQLQRPFSIELSLFS